MGNAVHAGLFSREVRAIKMRLPEGIDTAWISAALDRLRDARFNTVVLETNYHGYTLWPSPTQRRWRIPEERPSYSGRNVLAEFRKLAHDRGLKVWCWVETLFVGHSELEGAGPVLKAHPSWPVRDLYGGQHSGQGEHEYFFLCPSHKDVRDYLGELYAELARSVAPDAIFVDYLRYPVGSIGPEGALCYCDNCVHRAAHELDLDLRAMPRDPDNSGWQRWTIWRQDQTTQAMRELSERIRKANPRVPIVANVHGGWMPEILMHDTLRDWMSWAHEGLVDAVSTQNYIDDDQACIAQIQSDRQRLPEGMPFVPAITTGDISRGDRQLQAIRKLGAQGVAYFVYSRLTDENCRSLRNRGFSRL